MSERSLSFLGHWNVDQLLAWIVTRNIGEALTPGFWLRFKEQNADRAALAEDDLLHLFRCGDLVSDQRKIEAPHYEDWRDSNKMKELDRWPDCYAHRHELFDPDELLPCFPADCPDKPESQSGRTEFMQLAVWIAKRRSIASKRTMALGAEIKSILEACVIGGNAFSLYAWRGENTDGEPQIIHPDVIKAFVSESSNLISGPGLPGYGVYTGISVRTNGAVIWNCLHFLEFEINEIIGNHDKTDTFLQHVTKLKAGNFSTVQLPLLNGRRPHPGFVGNRHRGAPKWDDTKWLQLMHAAIRRGVSQLKAAEGIVERHGVSITGASDDAKRDRLRRKYREIKRNAELASLDIKQDD